ncbi:MAG: FIST signal transduction protein [Candidatus Nanoarchaeia archaeon]
MAIKFSIAEKMDEKNSVDKICEDIGEINPSLVIFFASSKHDIGLVGNELKNKMNTKVVGCTTSGELASGHMLKESVVAMGFDSETVSNISINNIDVNAISDSKIIEKVKNDIGVEPKQLDPEKHLGMIFIDGMSGKEEVVMDAIGRQFLIPVVGGSAGDDLKFSETYVFDNDNSKKGTAVLTVLEIPHGFDILKTQSFSDTGKKLMPTKVDEPKRQVIEFNNEPALEAYAKTIEKGKEEAKESFMTHPVGLMIGDDPYVRSPQRAEGDTMYFYCQIKEGTELSVLKSEDIVESTREFVNKAEGAKGLINFNCILRTLELEKKNQTQEYADLFVNIPTIGFSTYGEQFIGHINQTSTMVVFK